MFSQLPLHMIETHFSIDAIDYNAASPASPPH